MGLNLPMGVCLFFYTFLWMIDSHFDYKQKYLKKTMDWNSLPYKDPSIDMARISFALQKNLQKKQVLDSFSLSPL
jgi:hypothetical protein